jgi:TPR repeat protein
MITSQELLTIIDKADDNNEEAILSLCNLHMNKMCDKFYNDSTFIEHVKKSASNNKPYSLYELALMYLKSDDNKDIMTGLNYLEKSIKAKCSQAYCTASFYAEHGLVKYEFTASELRKKAMEMNNPNAYIFTAERLDQKKDSKKIVELLQKAIDLKSVYAIYVLGEYYHNQKKYKQAREWYSKGCDLNSDDCYFNLAVMYFEGEGVKQNSKKAITLFKKASELGNIAMMVKILKLSKCTLKGVNWMMRIV